MLRFGRRERRDDRYRATVTAILAHQRAFEAVAAATSATPELSVASHFLGRLDQQPQLIA